LVRGSTLTSTLLRGWKAPGSSERIEAGRVRLPIRCPATLAGKGSTADELSMVEYW
jgi:hypothetical protein